MSDYEEICRLRVALADEKEAHDETQRLALAALDSCKTQVTVGDLSYHLHTTEELCALAEHLDKLKAG